MTPPSGLSALCRTPEQKEWLAKLPGRLNELARRWSLTLPRPLVRYPASCAWVVPVQTKDGTSAILKLSLPHMEARDEIAGLRFWNGDPTVGLLEADEPLDALLLERCEPGTSLRELPEPEQDGVIASLLRRMWRIPPHPHPFRPLSKMLAFWSKETLAAVDRWSGKALVREGVDLFRTLSEPAASDRLLATDLHAGNVLRAQRKPWLAIDPKPFFGDPAYDATQHLLNCRDRLRSDGAGTVRRFADLLGVEEERVRLWTFARLAAEPRSEWANDDNDQLARALRP